MILLDTNVLSEALRPSPSRSVVKWLDQRFPQCAISSITIFELGSGVALMQAGRRKETIELAVARLIRRFGPRVYSFDAAAAGAAVQVLARARGTGMGLHQLPQKLGDLQIAGIASAYGLSLATRNVGDFQGLGLMLIDPWSESAE